MRKVIPIFIGLALLGIALSVAFPLFQAKKSGPGQFSALGGLLTLKAPPAWKEMDSLNPVANLKVGDEVADAYLIVVSEKKSEVKGDTHSVENYSKFVRGHLRGTLKNGRERGPWWVTVGSRRALRYEVLGTSQDGLDLVYLHTTVETPEYFHQIVGWTQAKDYPKNRSALRQISDSLREGGE